jgi:hypothetical protein
MRESNASTKSSLRCQMLLTSYHVLVISYTFVFIIFYNLSILEFIAFIVLGIK